MYIKQGVSDCLKKWDKPMYIKKGVSDFYKNETTQCISNRELVTVYKTGAKSDSAFFSWEGLIERNIYTNFTQILRRCVHTSKVQNSRLWRHNHQ
jgi:hypothetical protein